MNPWHRHVGLLGAPLFFAAAALAQSDTEPPVLTNFDFNPKSVDVTVGPVTVPFNLYVNDSPAGVGHVQVNLRTASGVGFGYGCDRTSGTIWNGVWTCSVTVPRYSAEGIWTVEQISLTDTVWNSTILNTAQLAARGFPTELTVGFVLGDARAVVSAPDDGDRVRGNSLTVRARLTQGNPTNVHPTLGVRFDYRPLPFGDFVPIPARDANHTNPDTSYPYFIHWDVSGLPAGDYELRAVAHDLAGTPDPAAATITITIDHAGPADVNEYVNADGRQENQTAVGSASEVKIVSGDHTVASTATDLTLPPGSLMYPTDTATLVYPDPIDEEGQLEQVEQSIGAFVDLSLLSGQTELQAGLTGDLNISYSDVDQDGVVDGTSIPEEDLQLRYFDPGTTSYVVMPSIVLTEHNMVHAEPGILGKFALAGPLLPEIWFENTEALVWDAVSSSLLYTVYRGLISALVDADANGLPDGGYGDCVSDLDIDPTDLRFVDAENPVENEGFYYIVGFVGPEGSAGLGNTSSGLRRQPLSMCP